MQTPSDTSTLMRLGTLALLAVGLTIAANADEEELTGAEILSKALDLRKGIDDFSAHFDIHLDIEDLDLPDSSGTIYFKHPDKLKVKPERGVVILPKDAIVPTRISKAIEEGADVKLMNQRDALPGVVYGLKLIPKEDDEGIRILAWVNGWNWTMEKMEIWRDDRKTMLIEWEHTLVQKRFWLPKTVTCELAQRARRGGRRMRGTASISFSEYRVNTGLPDTLFAKPEERR